MFSINAIVKIHNCKISRFYSAVSIELAILKGNKTTHHQPAPLCAYFAACCVVNTRSPSVISVMTSTCTCGAHTMETTHA